VTLVDVFLILLIASGAVAGYRQGLIAAFCSLLGAVVLAIGALMLAPVAVRDLESGLARTAVSMALLAGGVIIGELIGGWAGRVLSEQVRWSPARAADKTLGMLGQAVAVLLLAWVVALPLASAPIASLTASIRNSAILGVVNKVAPEGSQALAERLRSLLNSTGFPDILGPLDATPVIEVPEPDSGLAADPAVAATRASVVKIKASAPSCGKSFSGTGFAIGPNHVLTNAHVVGGSSTVTVEVRGGAKAATVVDYNSQLDLAVLYVPAIGVPALAFASTEQTAQSDAIVLGYPRGGPFAVSPARVRSTIQLSGPDIYQRQTVVRQVYLLRTSIQPGNSGGPVISRDGKVVGVVFGAAIDSPDTGFALTSAQVAGTVQAGLSDSSPAATDSCVLD
jgi:S1-C subfamily serine protease